jgi:hypothetical protein
VILIPNCVKNACEQFEIISSPFHLEQVGINVISYFVNDWRSSPLHSISTVIHLWPRTLKRSFTRYHEMKVAVNNSELQFIIEK